MTYQIVDNNEGGRARYRRQIREIRSQSDCSHQGARRIWRGRYERGAKNKISIRLLGISDPIGGLCPFCRDTFSSTDQRHRCKKCSASYHLECYRDELYGRCATLGCSTLREIRVSLRRRPPLVETPEQDVGVEDILPTLHGALLAIAILAIVIGAVQKLVLLL